MLVSIKQFKVIRKGSDSVRCKPDLTPTLVVTLLKSVGSVTSSGSRVFPCESCQVLLFDIRFRRDRRRFSRRSRRGSHVVFGDVCMKVLLFLLPLRPFPFFILRRVYSHPVKQILCFENS